MHLIDQETANQMLKVCDVCVMCVCVCACVRACVCDVCDVCVCDVFV